MKRSEMLTFIERFYGIYHDGEQYGSFCEYLLDALEMEGMTPPNSRWEPESPDYAPLIFTNDKKFLKK